MTLKEFIEDYCADLRSRGLSSHYYVNELKALANFKAHCSSHKLLHLEQLKLCHILAYNQSLREHGFQDICRYAMVGTVRRALKWANYRGYLLTNPVQDWQPRHPPLTSFRKVPTQAQMEALLDAPGQDTLEGLRDRVLLEFLYGTGLRVQECVDTTLPALDLRARILTVCGKGGKVREQPLGPQLTAKLLDYVQEVRPHLLGSKEDVTAVFLNDHGGPMQASSINARLRLYSRPLGVGDFSAHSIRHAFATHLLLGGAPLIFVQKLLGHDHASSTALYTRLLPLDVQEELLRTHPRAKRQGRKSQPSN